MSFFVGRRPAVVSLLSLWAVAAFGCGQANQYEPPPPPSVTVAKPLVKTVTNYIEETGTTEAVEYVEVRARVRGFLEQINFEPGADVMAGDVLYVIEQAEYQAKVAAARADLDAKGVALTKAEIEYGRQQKLFVDAATAETNVVAAQADRDGAIAMQAASQAALDQAKLNLEYTEVRTPIDGRVGKTLVKVGNLVGDSGATHLTTVISYDPIYANFNINERVFLSLIVRRSRDERIEADQNEIPFFLARAGDDGFPFEGHFNYADLAVDQSTGTYAIRGIFPNPDQKIVPGLFVRVRIPIGIQEDALLIPELALGADQAGRYALVVSSQNIVERRNVTVGIKDGDMVVIDEGLGPDDWVVIQGVQRARAGAEVKPNQTLLAAGESEVVTVQSEIGQSVEETAPDTEVPDTNRAEVVPEEQGTVPDSANAPPNSP